MNNLSGVIYHLTAADAREWSDILLPRDFIVKENRVLRHAAWLQPNTMHELIQL